MIKQYFLALLLILFAGYVHAQQAHRNIRFKTFGRDSVNLPLNDEYFLIEDSCSQIIRYCHFNFERRKFSGKFQDVSKSNPDLVVCEGTYTEDGLKNGNFVTHYLNGNLQAKGEFKDDSYDGQWEMFYQTGQPELTFEVVNRDLRITNCWKKDGTKVVDNGNGLYVADIGNWYWKGKLVSGKPDGRWKLYKTDDISNMPVASEYFKKGQFHDGSRGDFNYTDESRITLVSVFKLPFVNAEKMFVSPTPCNGKKRKHIVGAQYQDGLNSFSGYISDAVTPFFSQTNLKSIDNTIVIDGEISEDGSLINLKNNGSFREEIVRGIILRLRNLPPLHPATADGVPIRQKFTITFKIFNGLYSFTYRFLPIQND